MDVFHQLSYILRCVRCVFKQRSPTSECSCKMSFLNISLDYMRKQRLTVVPLQKPNVPTLPVPKLRGRQSYQSLIDGTRGSNSKSLQTRDAASLKARVRVTDDILKALKVQKTFTAITKSINFSATVHV